ncbi:MAG: hypothetical protein ACI9OD_002060, partial [Limisphaerales bacterium]
MDGVNRRARRKSQTAEFLMGFTQETDSSTPLATDPICMTAFDRSPDPFVGVHASAC